MTSEEDILGGEYVVRTLLHQFRLIFISPRVSGLNSKIICGRRMNLYGGFARSFVRLQTRAKTKHWGRCEKEGKQLPSSLAPSVSPRPTETASSSGKRPERAGEVGEDTDLSLSGLVMFSFSHRGS